MSGTIAVIAKAPVPGAVKTRLCPPLSPSQAAALAEAALSDTLEAVAATGVRRKVLVLAGSPGSWLPAGVGVIEQRGGGLDERLAAAFVDLPGPTLVVGMDTPQVATAMLEGGLQALGDYDAVLGPSADGGYWAIGLRHGDERALIGVPMSSEHTLGAQRMRLHALGFAVAELETLRDVDTFADAVAVATEAPETRFAGALADLLVTTRAA
jgi:rSAM/selenodomain-associated transferase 1